MKLTNSDTEKECRADLIDSKKYLMESEKGQHVLKHARKICGDIKTIYALSHTPEQGEDIFRVLVNGERIFGFDLQDEAGQFEAFNITTYSLKEYERLLTGKMGKLMLAIALDLSKGDMQVDN
ncbi:hypothetical protein LIN78_05095 [Leeia sp. TBRC 13508]|uniref:Uncharacterized protein n=1 Tax=Leeia speluncae TaxID=2884804 RepID=A0ABS8D4K3_9NEIS|nr:hypothetical protein [Leeia speluncae]MCB6182923.1 hypothetical protein [Leeia speluncae]